MPRAAIIVGVGGEGKVVLMKIRRLIVEEYGSLSALPHIRFLHVDTCTNKQPEGSQNFDQEVLGQDILFDQGKERIELSKNLPQKPVDHPKVKEWYPDNLPITCNFVEGAGGVRAFGRVAFHYNVHHFRKYLNKAAWEVANIGTDGLDIYIVCSFFGGTGSGIFLDVCYNVRDELKRMQLGYKILGFFIIGARNPDSNMQNNCYAALKELEYYTTKGILTTLKKAGKDDLVDYYKDIDNELKPFEARYPVAGLPDISSDVPPVDNCYLYGAVNSEGAPFDRDALEQAVSRRIFFESMPGIGDTIRAKGVDIMGQPAYYTPDRLQNRAKSFFTTGLSVIEFPAPRIMNALASGLAAYCCHYALFTGAAGFSDLKGEVEKFIEERNLTERRLERELEKQDAGIISASIKDDTSNWTRKILDNINGQIFDKDKILQNAHKARTEAIERIREGQDTKSSGIYVQTIRNNGLKIRKDMETNIEELIGGYVGDKEKGPDHTEGFISALLSRLSGEEKGYSDMKDSFDLRMRNAKRTVDWRIERIQDDLCKKYRWELKKHAHWLCEQELTVFLNMGKKKIFCGAAYDVVHKTMDKLDRLKIQINSYQENLNRWKKEYIRNMVDVFKNLDGQLENDPVNESLRDILRQVPHEPDKWENDIVGLYKNFVESLFKSYNITNPITDMDEVVEEVIKKACDGQMGIALFRQVLSSSENFRKSVFETCREKFQSIKKVSICDLLLNIDETACREILNKKKKDAACLLQVDTYDETLDHVPDLCERKWTGVSNTIDIKTHPIWKHLSEYHADEARFRSLSEPYRMIFVGEMGIFCLRNVNLLDAYRKTYNDVQGEHHANKQIEFPDIMPPDPMIGEIHLRAERAALIGKILGFLKEETDPVDHYPAIFLHFSDQKTMTRKNERLCKKWKEVEFALKDIQTKKEIGRKTGKVTALEKLEREIRNKLNSAKTKEEKEKLWQATENYLKKRLDDIKDEKHPFYQKDLNIIEDFRKEHNFHPHQEERS